MSDHELPEGFTKVAAWRERLKASTDGEAVADASNASAVAPDPCNTGATSSQGTLETGGIDTLYDSLYGPWTDRRWTQTRALFERLRTDAEQGIRDRGACELLDGDKIVMQAAGAKKGIFCRYVFQWEGCRVYVVDSPAEVDSRPSVFVQFGSLALMTRGLDLIREGALRLLASLGFQLKREVVGRLDVCVDLPNVDVEPFVLRMLARRCITRARKGAIYFDYPRSLTGFDIGESRLKLRVYDKLLETTSDPAKREYLVQRRWGGLPKAATRVEFQLSRDVLRDRWNLGGCDDLRLKLPHILEWLCRDWFRFTAEDVDRENKNQIRAETWTGWLAVQKAFTQWVGRATEPITIPKRVKQPCVERLVKQAMGCLASAVAMGDRDIASGTDLLWRSNELMRPDADAVAAEVAQRRIELEAEGNGAIADETRSPF